jgi:hypothetical protein
VAVRGTGNEKFFAGKRSQSDGTGELITFVAKNAEEVRHFTVKVIVGFNW